MNLSNLSVKHKLFFIILAILMPMIIVQGYSLLSHYNEIIEYEMEINQDFAIAIGTVFKIHIAGISEDLTYLGETIAYSQMSIDEINSFLTRLNIKSNVQSYSWIDPDGTILASSLQKTVGSNIGEREYYSRILAGEDLVISDVMTVSSDSEPFMGVLRAVREGPVLLGIMAARLDLEYLDAIMPEQRTSTTNSFGIADRYGTIVYRHGHPHIIQQMITVNPYGAAGLALKSGKIESGVQVKSPVTNTVLSGVAVPIPEIGWVTYATSNYQEVLSKAFNSIKYNLVVLFIAITLSLFLALKVSRSILHPMSTMKYFAQQISEGNFAVRTNIIGSDEMAATGSALDQMAFKIKDLEINRKLFIQSSAHELRNPMMGIKGIAFLIRNRIRAGKPIQEIENMLDIIEREIDRLSAIVNQLLEAYKENAFHGGLHYKWEVVNLQEVLSKVVTAVQARTDRHEIIVETDQEHVFINGDGSKLEDVLRNLLGNAIKYSADEKKILVSIHEVHGSAVIAVRDRGIGIPEEHLEDIFESFFRGQNFAGKDPGGMGLGLYICKEIIKNHGGKIWAENNEDVGTTFYVKIPLHKEIENGQENPDN